VIGHLDDGEAFGADSLEGREGEVEIPSKAAMEAGVFFGAKDRPAKRSR
jgi:hypothetical protein